MTILGLFMGLGLITMDPILFPGDIEFTLLAILLTGELIAIPRPRLDIAKLARPLEYDIRLGALIGTPRPVGVGPGLTCPP